MFSDVGQPNQAAQEGGHKYKHSTCGLLWVARRSEGKRMLKPGRGRRQAEGKGGQKASRAEGTHISKQRFKQCLNYFEIFENEKCNSTQISENQKNEND